MISAFSSVKELTLWRPNSSFFSTYLSLHYFPRLTKLSLWRCKDGVADQLLSELWEVSSSLTSLDISECPINADIAERHTRGDYGPPAFAQTLSSLKTTGFCAGVVLDMLAPYCRNLQEIRTKNYHDGIMINNPRLTSLTLSDCASSAIDLTPHHLLVNLCLDDPGQISSATRHSNLETIFLDNPRDIEYASQFLTQCPALEKASVRAQNWQDMVKIISVLNPDQCALHLKLKSGFPSVAQVDEVILQRGFRVNEEFFLQAHDAVEEWGRIMEIAPGIQHLEELYAINSLDHFFLQQLHLLPSCFASFPALTTLDVSTDIDWTQEMIVCIVKTCATLKILQLRGRNFSGVLHLESISLHKVNLCFYAEHSGFHLMLPNLSHLHLLVRGGELILLQGILEGDDPLIQLPLLRVLNLCFFNAPTSPLGSIMCKAGHRSLAQVTIDGIRRSEIEKLTLQNVPSLQKLILKPPPPHVVLDIPSRCDVIFAHSPEDFSYYNHKGYRNGESKNFVAQILLKDDGKSWEEQLGASTRESGHKEDEEKQNAEINSQDNKKGAVKKKRKRKRR